MFQVRAVTLRLAAPLIAIVVLRVTEPLPTPNHLTVSDSKSSNHRVVSVTTLFSLLLADMTVGDNQSIVASTKLMITNCVLLNFIIYTSATVFHKSGE
jgi:hypothetical protein